MKKTLYGLSLCLLSVAAASAGTVYNNYGGNSDYWHPLGFPNTATYGEVFTAPTNGDNVLDSFGFYIGTPIVAGDIILGAYISTWNGTVAGAPLFSSGPVDYANTAPSFLDFTTGGLSLTPGGSYVMYLSISDYYGQSSGQAYVSQGSSIAGLGGFVYNNNSGSFGDLQTVAWSGPLSPDWAVDLEFSGGSVPEPGTLPLMGSAVLAVLGATLRRRVRR